MISERDISEKFSAIWKQNFPLLTPNFIRVLNDTQIVDINTTKVISSEEIRYDLVSEAAFNLSEFSFLNKLSAYEAFTDIEQIRIIQKTAKSIWKSVTYSDSELAISEKEKQEIISISNNILEFIQNLGGGKNIYFKPKLKGYSFIPDLYGDILIDDTLFEIKTVNRNFKSSDLKQLLIYIALRQVSDKKNWKYAGLYNPRKGYYCKFNIKTIIYNLTGGKTPNEALEQLLSGLNRDIEIDSRF